MAVEQGAVEAPADEALVRQAREGDQDALLALLGRYRRLLRALARRYFLPWGDVEDLLQEATLGLLKAVRDYRPELGLPFRSFAELCMHRQVITAVKTGVCPVRCGKVQRGSGPGPWSDRARPVSSAGGRAGETSGRSEGRPPAGRHGVTGGTPAGTCALPGDADTGEATATSRPCRWSSGRGQQRCARRLALCARRVRHGGRTHVGEQGGPQAG